MRTSTTNTLPDKEIVDGGDVKRKEKWRSN